MEWKIPGLKTMVLNEFDTLLEDEVNLGPTTALVGLQKRLRNDELQVVLCSATATDLLIGRGDDNHNDHTENGIVNRYLRP